MPELEKSDFVPKVIDLRVRFDAVDGPEPLKGRALEVHDIFEAAKYLQELAGWRMMREAKRGLGGICGRKAIAIERHEPSFYALACDVSSDRLAKIRESPCLAQMALFSRKAWDRPLMPGMCRKRSSWPMFGCEAGEQKRSATIFGAGFRRSAGGAAARRPLRAKAA